MTLPLWRLLAIHLCQNTLDWVFHPLGPNFTKGIQRIELCYFTKGTPEKFCLLKIKHTILFYWRNQGQAFRLAVKTLVKIPAPHTGAPGFKTPLQLLIPASCYEDWEAGITAQVTGILPPTGEAWNEFLASSWTSPTCCRHLGSDPPDGSSVSLTLKLKK